MPSSSVSASDSRFLFVRLKIIVIGIDGGHSPSSGSWRLRPIASSTAPNEAPPRSVGQALHRFDAMLLQNPLHAADSVALAVKQAANALEQIDIIGAIVASSAASLHRFDLGEPRLPKPQHMLRDVEFFSDFADGAERIRRLVQMTRSSQLTLIAKKNYSVLPSPLPAAWPLIRCFNIADGLNTITRRGEIGTSVPVFGITSDTLTLLAHHEGAE